MLGSGTRGLNLLLLDRKFWRERLADARSAAVSAHVIPRPELSSASVQVNELRLRMHDGVRLFGLEAQPRPLRVSPTALVRLIGPCDTPELDYAAASRGETAFVLQELAGRKLEDRVLDLVRVCRFAARAAHRQLKSLRVVSTRANRDELLIACQLLADDGDDAIVLTNDESASTSLFSAHCEKG